jgi:hypothetical protein
MDSVGGWPVAEETVDTIYYKGGVYRITSVEGGYLPFPVWYGVEPLVGMSPNPRGYQMCFALEGSQLVLIGFSGMVSAKEAEKGFQPINGVSPNLEGSAPVRFDYPELHLKVEFNGILGIRLPRTEDDVPTEKMGLRFEKGVLREDVGADAAGEDDSEKVRRAWAEQKHTEMQAANAAAAEFETREKLDNEFQESVSRFRENAGQEQKSEKVQEEEMAAAMLRLKKLKEELRKAPVPAEGHKCPACGSVCKTGTEFCPGCGAKL